MAAVDVKVPSLHQLGAGRSNAYDFGTGYVSGVSYNNTPSVSSAVGSRKKLSLLTSTIALGHAHASSVGGSPPASRSYKQQGGFRPTLRNIDTGMTSYTSTTTTVPAPTTRSDARINKLHKRGGSGSSLPATPSPLSGAHAQYITPFATHEEPFPDISSTPPTSSTPKIKPYLRKLSAAKEDEDQGRLDLSKSTSENGALSGLGIQDFGSRTASEVTFSHTGRSRTPHMRTTSTGSQISVGSGSFKPTQPFIHPMRQTPNGPYTPTGQSYASSLNEDERRESSDIVTDEDVQIGQSFRNSSRRSASISSTPQIQPTPLSQSHTAADLGYIPKLTTSSQTNLSFQSGPSEESSKSKLTRPRRNTERSEFANSRTSLDKAFRSVSRRSDPDPRNRDERIREARRKFEAKEANKDKKMEKQALKRRETDDSNKEENQRRRRQSSLVASQSEGGRSKLHKQGAPTEEGKKSKNDRRSDDLRSRSYDDLRPAALPHHGMSEKIAPRKAEGTRRAEASSSQQHSGWTRFSVWMQTRLLSCGGKGA